MADIVVQQSTESSSVYNTEVQGHDVKLQFLSANKGRLEFMVSVAGKSVGKFNLLSQHSIRRIAKPGGIPEIEIDQFVADMVQVGVMLKEGNFKPAEKRNKSEEGSDDYKGKSSSMGPIDEAVCDDFLMQPDLILRISDIMHHSRPEPFIGDESNLILTFLVMLSCKTGFPLNLELIGQSASGKTYMALTARNAMPPWMVSVLAGASREALKYDYDEVDAEGNFISYVDGKCIIILEKDDSLAFMRRMKPLMSGDDDELIWKTPLRNELTGEIETKSFIIKGQPSFITLTCRNPKEEEQVTRQLLMTPDTRPEKVKAVVAGSLMARARPEELALHEDLDLCQASMGRLDKYQVRNIFAPLLVEFFPARSAQHQRDVKKVLSIVDSLAVLHQKQRPNEDINGEMYVLASIEDNILALALSDLVLRASLSGVPDDTWMVFLEMCKMEEAGRSLTEDSILQWLHIHAFNCSKQIMKEKYLNTLADAGLLEVSNRGGGRGGARKTWRIVHTRRNLIEAYALTPLFVAEVKKSLPSVMAEFSDVLVSAEPAESHVGINRRQKNQLSDMGITEMDVACSLVYSQYLTWDGRGSVIHSMFSGTKAQQHLFTREPTWMKPDKDETGLEVGLEKHNALQQRLKDGSTDIAADDGDYWDSLLDAHDEGFDGEVDS